MAVASLNLAVLPMDEQFGSLVPTDLSGCVNGLNLCLEMSANAVCAVSANIPPAFRVGYDVMRSAFGHFLLLTQRPSLFTGPIDQLYLDTYVFKS